MIRLLSPILDKEPGWKAFAQRMRRALRAPRRAIPTIPGLFALGAPTFLGLAAVTATNNLLFLLLGATLGSIVLSGILSERCIQPIQVRLRSTGPAYAEEATRIEVRFKRKKADQTAFDLRFRELPRGNYWPFLTRRIRPPQILQAQLPVLEGREASVMASRVFKGRGQAQLDLCEISTRYPFGLLTKSKDVEPNFMLLVRPRRIERPAELFRPPGVSGVGVSSHKKGSGVDLYGLRERNEQDPWHRVHALRSLTVGRDVVLEMTGTERPIAEIGVATDSTADPEALERALELAQSALLGWIHEGFDVGLTTFSKSYAPGEVEPNVLLDHLAVVVGTPHCVADGRPGTWLVPEGASCPYDAAILDVGSSGIKAVRGPQA